MKKQPSASNMKAYSPKPGDILSCYFPEAENPYEPGPKYRPVIVGKFNSIDNVVAVVYGTSQTDDARDKPRAYYEFCISPKEKGNALSKNTLFNARRWTWLPYTPQYFWCDGRQKRLGIIPATRFQEIGSIISGEINKE